MTPQAAYDFHRLAGLELASEDAAAVDFFAAEYAFFRSATESPEAKVSLTWERQPAFGAVRPGYRRWLSPRLSLDVGLGPVVAPGFGASAEVSLTVADLVAVTSDVAVLDQGGSDTTTWYFGAKTGSYAGLATYAAGAVAGLLYIASVLRH